MAINKNQIIKYIRCVVILYTGITMATTVQYHTYLYKLRQSTIGQKHNLQPNINMFLGQKPQHTIW